MDQTRARWMNGACPIQWSESPGDSCDPVAALLQWRHFVLADSRSAQLRGRDARLFNSANYCGIASPARHRKRQHGCGSAQPGEYEATANADARSENDKPDGRWRNCADES